MLAPFALPFAARGAAIDEEHIYGFTEGSEIGNAGDIDAHLESFGRNGARRGSLSAVSNDVTILYTLTDSFRVAPIFTLDTTRSRGVPGVLDHSTTLFEGPAVEFKYRVADYKTRDYGLTFAAVPYYARVDALTGERVTQVGSAFRVSLSKMLVPDMLFAAGNLVYGLSRSRKAGAHDDTSSFETSGALSLRVADAVLVGGELRYVRDYTGLGLDHMAGAALYAGPNFYCVLSERSFLAGGLSVRLTGRDTLVGTSAGSARASGALSGFTPFQSILRLGYTF